MATQQAQPTTPAEGHAQGQAALTGLVPVLLAQAWPLLDVHDLKGTLPRFQTVVEAIVRRYGQASAAAALDFYQRERISAGVPGRPVLRTVDPVASDAIESAIRWATSDLWGAKPANLPPGAPAPVQVAQDRLDAAAEQLVLQHGRQQVMSAAQQDREAKGWARVPEPGACSFCLMLATRGAVYKSQAAMKRTSARFEGGGYDFKVHDHCRCHVEPVFTHYEPPASVREAQRLWEQATAGRSGHDARVAFRQAVEGRPVTGAKGSKGAKKSATAKPAMTRAQIEHQIALTEGLKDSAWKTQQLRHLRSLLKGS